MNFFREALLFGGKSVEIPEDAFIRFNFDNTNTLSPYDKSIVVPSAILEASYIPRLGAAGLFAGCSLPSYVGSSNVLAFPNLVSIGDYGMAEAFAGAGPRFARAEFPALTTLGTGAFQQGWMYAMTTGFTCPSLQTIGDNAFMEAWKMNTCIGGENFPETWTFSEVLTIGEYAFYHAFDGAKNGSSNGGGMILQFPKVVSIATSAFTSVFDNLLYTVRYGVSTNYVKLPLQFSSMLSQIGLGTGEVQYYDYRTDEAGA